MTQQHKQLYVGYQSPRRAGSPRIVTVTDGRINRPLAIVGTDDNPEDIELATLFASAPDLLAALERILAAIEWSVTSDRLTNGEMADTARAVIAKAKGGA